MPIPPRDHQHRTILSAEVRDRIRDAILSGSLRPGEHLSETKLVAQFGVSRTTLRRALTDLANTGLVEVRANRSPRVTSLDDADVPDAVFTLGLLMRGVVRFAVPELSSAEYRHQLAGIEGTITAIETADVEHLQRDTIDGYHRWADACPNTVLAETLHQRVDMLGSVLVRTDSTVEPQAVLAGLHLLRTGVHDRDGALAVRAIDTMHRPDRIISNRGLRNLRAADAARWSPEPSLHS